MNAMLIELGFQSVQDNTRKLMEWFFTNVSFVQTSMLGAHKPPPPPRHRVSSRNHTIDQQFFSLAVLLPSPRSSSLLRFGIGHDGHPLSVLDLAMELYHCEKGEKQNDVFENVHSLDAGGDSLQLITQCLYLQFFLTSQTWFVRKYTSNQVNLFANEMYKYL